MNSGVRRVVTRDDASSFAAYCVTGSYGTNYHRSETIDPYVGVCTSEASYSHSFTCSYSDVVVVIIMGTFTDSHSAEVKFGRVASSKSDPWPTFTDGSASLTDKIA